MAINAHFEEQAEQDRRRSARRRLLLEIDAAPGSGHTGAVLVHDISATGMLVECDAALPEGETIEVDLPQAGPTLARIAWQSGQFHGCEFATPLSEAALSAARLKGQERGATSAGPAGEPEPLGTILQRARLDAGLSLQDLADRLGVSKPTVWAWEHDRARPVEHRFAEIAAVLEIDPAALRQGHEIPAQQALVMRAREDIARAYGTSVERVRIMVEL